MYGGADRKKTFLRVRPSPLAVCAAFKNAFRCIPVELELRERDGKLFKGMQRHRFNPFGKVEAIHCRVTSPT